MTRRERPVLVYDGDCGFCTSSARFLERHVPVSATVVAFQFADLDALGTTAERAGHEVLWVDRAGRVSGGAEAVGRLLTEAGGPWRALGVVMRVPPVSWAAHGVYRLVAANRHRMPGGTAACSIAVPSAPGAGRPPSTGTAAIAASLRLARGLAARSGSRSARTWLRTRSQR